jgi:glycosyl transferase family 2
LRIGVVIPALDEEQAIGLVVREVRPLAAEVVVVDNGSRDRTVEVAREAGARVVAEPRRGYGQACLTGIAALGDAADVIVFLDGDYSDHPAQLPELVAPIFSGQADLVIGSRTLGRAGQGSHPWHAVAGTRFCVALMNLLIGTRASDLGPFRAVTRTALAALGMQDRNYGWTVEMQIKARRAGLRVTEVPVDYRARIGRSKVSGTVTGTVRAAAKILGTIVRYAVAPMRRALVLGIGAAVLSGCVASWARTGDQTVNVQRFLATYALAFVAYLAALHWSGGLAPRGLRIVLGLAVLWRIVLVFTPPLLSDDVYRYVWEGRIQLHGGNPYVWEDRPEGARWAPLRDDVWRGVSHKYYSALYPPAWQMAARAVVWLHDSVTAMKAFLAACEMGALAMLGWILRRRDLPPERILIMAWSPLALVEVAGSGHNDAFAVLLTVAALAALETGRPAAAAVAGAIALDAKILPGFIVAAWARRFRWWHAALAGVVAAALFVPYAAAGSGLWHSAIRYARYWRFNETLFALLRAVFEVDAAVTASTALLIATVAAIAWKRTETASAGLIVATASLLLAANVLPWYALWFLPFLVLRDGPPALLFTGTVALAYLAYPDWRSGETWQVSWWVRALEYGPCAVVAWLARPRGAR